MGEVTNSRGVVERDIIDDLLRINESSITALLEMKVLLEQNRSHMEKIGYCVPDVTRRLEILERVVDNIETMLKAVSENVRSLADAAKNYDVAAAGIGVREIALNIKELGLGQERLAKQVEVLRGGDRKFKNAMIIIGSIISLVTVIVGFLSLVMKHG